MHLICLRREIVFFVVSLRLHAILFGRICVFECSGDFKRWKHCFFWRFGAPIWAWPKPIWALFEPFRNLRAGQDKRDNQDNWDNWERRDDQDDWDANPLGRRACFFEVSVRVKASSIDENHVFLRFGAILVDETIFFERSGPLSGFGRTLSGLGWTLSGLAEPRATRYDRERLGTTRRVRRRG